PTPTCQKKSFHLKSAIVNATIIAMAKQRVGNLLNSERTHHLSGRHPSSPVKARDRNSMRCSCQHPCAFPRFLSQRPNLVYRFPCQLRACGREPADGEHLRPTAGFFFVIPEPITWLTASHFFHFAIERQRQQLTNTK